MLEIMSIKFISKLMRFGEGESLKHELDKLWEINSSRQQKASGGIYPPRIGRVGSWYVYL
jgi:hypothetical protein